MAETYETEDSSDGSAYRPQQIPSSTVAHATAYKSEDSLGGPDHDDASPSFRDYLEAMSTIRRYGQSIGVEDQVSAHLNKYDQLVQQTKLKRAKTTPSLE